MEEEEIHNYPSQIILIIREDTGCVRERERERLLEEEVIIFHFSPQPESGDTHKWSQQCAESRKNLSIIIISSTSWSSPKVLSV